MIILSLVLHGREHFLMQVFYFEHDVLTMKFNVVIYAKCFLYVQPRASCQLILEIELDFSYKNFHFTSVQTKDVGFINLPRVTELVSGRT